MGAHHMTYVVSKDKFGEVKFVPLHCQWNSPSYQPERIIRFLKVFKTWSENITCIERGDWLKAYRYSVAVTDAGMNDFQDLTEDFKKPSDMYKEENEHGDRKSVV